MTALVIAAIVWRDSILRSTTRLDASGLYARIAELSWALVAAIGAIPFAVHLLIASRSSRSPSMGKRVVAGLATAVILAAVPAATFKATRPEERSGDATPTAPSSGELAPLPSNAVSPAPSPAPTAAPSSGEDVVIVDDAPRGFVRPPVTSSSSQSQGSSGGQSQRQSP